MDKNYMIITEIRNNGNIDRYYYDMYSDRDYANDVAIRLNDMLDELERFDKRYRVIEADVAKEWGVNDLPY